LPYNNVVSYRRPRERKQGVSKKHWLLLFSFAFIVLLALYLASPLALVGKIEVHGLEFLEEVEIVTSAGLEPGMHFWRLNLAACRDKLSANPWVLKARISRKFPNIIVISIVERQGIAIIRDGGKSWVVADDGMILAENTGFSLPWITGLETGELAPGCYLQEQDASLALAWIGQLRPLAPQISEILLDHYPVYISIYTSDGFEVLLACNTNPEERILDLIALLQELRQGKQKGIIDFRAGPGRGVFSPWPGEDE
jgi:cell division protein FtsQ